MHAEDSQKKTVKQKVAHEFEELAILTLYLAFFFVPWRRIACFCWISFTSLILIMALP